MAFVIKFAAQPFGACTIGASDALTRKCADILLEDSDARDRLTSGLYLGSEGDSVFLLEQAFVRVLATEPFRQAMKRAHVHDIEEAVKSGIITINEAAELREADSLVSKLVAVDDFAADELRV